VNKLQQDKLGGASNNVRVKNPNLLDDRSAGEAEECGEEDLSYISGDERDFNELV
jgi:hypothetical protein